MRALGAVVLAALACAGAAEAGTVRVALPRLDGPEVAWNLQAHVADLCTVPHRAAPLRWTMHCVHADAVAGALAALPLRAGAKGSTVTLSTSFPWRRLPLVLERVTVPSVPRMRVVSRGPARIVAARGSLRPDVVLMDISMPVMDGLEATEKICAATPGACVLVLTGSNSPQDVAASRKAGAAGYVTKDGIAADLVQAILDAARG